MRGRGRPEEALARLDVGLIIEGSSCSRQLRTKGRKIRKPEDHRIFFPGCHHCLKIQLPGLAACRGGGDPGGPRTDSALRVRGVRQVRINGYIVIRQAAAKCGISHCTDLDGIPCGVRKYICRKCPRHGVIISVASIFISVGCIRYVRGPVIIEVILIGIHRLHIKCKDPISVILQFPAFVGHIEDAMLICIIPPAVLNDKGSVLLRHDGLLPLFHGIVRNLMPEILLRICIIPADDGNRMIESGRGIVVIE